MKDYNTLLQEKILANQRISYSEELSTNEWKKRREEIIERDNGTCCLCRHKPSDFGNPENYRSMTDDEKAEYLKEFQASFSQSEKETYLEVFNFLPKPAFYLIPKFDNLPTKPIILNVHHKFYVRTRLAWEYQDDELITYCQDCHQEIHDNFKIPCYEDEAQVIVFHLTSCERCNGSGQIPEYYYVKNGICFSCHGNKYLNFR